MIALTGTNGFLGSYLADKLPFPQRRLIHKTQLKPAPSFPYERLKGDFRCLEDIKQLIDGAPILIHLACTSNPRSSNQNIISDIDQNLLSTLRLFETFASTHPEGHIIFTSSGGNMYEANTQDGLRTEDDLPCPRSSYAIHKLALEHYLRQFCDMYRIKATILRISNPYGTLLSTHRVQGLIGVAFSKLLAGEELQIFDSLETVRDYIHLDDVVRAFQLALQFPPHPGECRLFNVSSGCGFSNAAILDLIDQTTQLKIKRTLLFKKPPAPSWSVLSYAKIQQALGWQPTIPLEKGIKAIWNQTLNIHSNPLISSYATCF